MMSWLFFFFFLTMPVMAQVFPKDQIVLFVTGGYFGSISPAALTALEREDLNASNVNDVLQGIGRFLVYAPPAPGGYEELPRSSTSLGVDLAETRNDQILLVPHNGGPTYNAGLRRAVFVQSINGLAIPNRAAAIAATSRLRAGSQAVIRFRRGEDTMVETVSVSPQYWLLPTMEINSIDGLGFIRVYEFVFEETADRIRSALLGTLSTSDTIVLDLRYAIGGNLNEAIRSLGLFLRNGTVVGLIEGNSYTEQKKVVSIEENPVWLGRFIVLISAATKSAAEIVANFARYSGRAAVIGERSFGKCVVTRLHRLHDGGTLIVPIAEAREPGGRRCHHTGVEPLIALPPADLHNDPWLLTRLLRPIVDNSSMVCVTSDDAEPPSQLITWGQERDHLLVQVNHGEQGYQYCGGWFDPTSAVAERELLATETELTVRIGKADRIFLTTRDMAEMNPRTAIDISGEMVAETADESKASNSVVRIPEQAPVAAEVTDDTPASSELPTIDSAPIFASLGVFAVQSNARTAQVEANEYLRETGEGAISVKVEPYRGGDNLVVKAQGFESQKDAQQFCRSYRDYRKNLNDLRAECIVLK